MFFIVIIIILIVYLYSYNTNLCDLESDIEKINKSGISVCVNKIGNNNTNVDEIKRRILFIKPNQSQNLQNKISVKTSSLSGDLLKRYEEILSFAKIHNTFVWMSAETVEFNQKNKMLYTGLIKTFNNVGITIQAYHDNSVSLVKQILSMGGHIRLVKGFYMDGKSKHVWDNYKTILDMLVETNGHHEIATHNFKLLKPYVEIINNSNLNYGFSYLNKRYTLKNCKKLNIPPGKCSFYLSYGRPYKFVKGYLF